MKDRLGQERKLVDTLAMHRPARVAIMTAAISTAALWSVRCSPVATSSAAREQAAFLTPCQVTGVDRPVRCGTVDVLESPADPSGRRLAIRVVVVPARDTAALPDPMLFLVGGPGQGAADLARALVPRTDFLNDIRDVVLVDQRGSGASNGLACPPVARTHDLFGRLFDPTLLAACRDELSTRADLTRYTTEAAAADFERVIDALGYRQVNLWGGSYGTRMGLELSRRMPDRVRTLTLEGVVPTFFTWPTFGAHDFQASLDAVVADCEAEEECARGFPTFRRDVDAAFASLERGPVTVNVRDPRNGQDETVSFRSSDLAYAVRGLLYGAQALTLPRLFRDAAGGRFQDFAQAYVARARTIERELAIGLHLSVYCAEDLPYLDQAQAEQLSDGTRMGRYLLDEYRRACEIWPRATISEGYRDPITSRVPTLMFTGQRDPVTPPRTAHDAARTLERGRVLTWRYGGHNTDGLASPECRQDIIRTFVTTADVDHLPVECMTSGRPW